MDQRARKVPALIRAVSPLGRMLLRLGVPMGPDILMTVRGRKSGLPRTVAVALVDIEGRRWVIGAYGNVHWVLNLRATREAVIDVGRRPERVSAVELSREEAAAFYRDALPPFIAGLPLFLRAVTIATLRSGSPDILDHPARAAQDRPVFELRPMSD